MSSFRLDEREKAKSLASYFKGIEERLDTLERSNQLNYASIEGGSLDIYDADGALKGSVGVQPDGGVALVPDPENTEPPPTPTAPTVEPALAGLVIGWDGQWADAEFPPSDFALIQVHVGATADFTPAATTQIATIGDVTGGTVTVHIEGYAPVWVRMVAANTAALTGDPSAAVEGLPRQAVPQDLIDGIITEVKLAEDAVTQTKIATGAVGSTALADGAVLAEKLAQNSVTLNALAAGSVTLNALTGPLGDSATQRYTDTFRDPTAWAQLSASGGGTWVIDPAATNTPSGGGLLTATGDVQLAGKALIAQDVDTLYRVMIRVRATAQDVSGPSTVYLGAAGVADDGVTFVNRSGVASTSMHYYCATNGGTLAMADGWKVYVGYIQGRAAAGATAPAGPQTDPRSPGATHANVRFLRPMAWLNFGKNRNSVMEVDCFTIEALRTGVVNSTNLVTGSVTAAAIATDAVIAGKISADAVTAREIAAGSIVTAKLAAGAVTAEKLTIVGGSNVLPDPSFEGPAGAAIAAQQTYLSIDKTFGNGSPASLKLDATSATAATRGAELTLLPVTAGDQVYVAADYYPSASWVGTEINLQVRWERADGTVLSTSKLSDTAPVKGAWGRATGTVTAPANAVLGRVRVESVSATAGSVSWDNAAVRPVVPGVQIADGAITAPKILTGAVTTDKLDALSVTAAKIAALAITTDKISALAVTADKLAVNSVTATSIAAGVIDSTHIKAGSISADRLQIGTSPNMLPDPSFEGAGGEALVAGQTYWSITNTGNGSSKSILANAVASSPVIRTLTLAVFPILPGQSLRLATDVRPSSDWNGASVRIYARWTDSAGNVTFGFVTNTSPPKGAWSTLDGVVTAPAGTVSVELRLATYDATLGSVQYDNAIVQPMVGKVQIADGAITADKLDATAINGKTITGATVQTAASGSRVVMGGSTLSAFGAGAAKIVVQPDYVTPLSGDDPSPRLYFTSDDGSNIAYTQAQGTGDSVNLWTYSGSFTDPGDGLVYRWRSRIGKDEWTVERIRELGWVGQPAKRGTPRFTLGKTSAYFDVPLVQVEGILRAGNIATGRVTIQPTAANTPTGVTVSFNLTGSNPRATATPSTTLPGKEVTGVGVTDVSLTSATVWLTRTNTTSTGVDYQVIAS